MWHDITMELMLIITLFFILPLNNPSKWTHFSRSSRTSYSRAVGNMEQRRLAMPSMEESLGFSATDWINRWWIKSHLFDWRKTRGELGAEANPRLACSTIASRLACVDDSAAMFP